MVFVTVCDDNTPYFVFLIQKVIDIRDHQINAKHFFPWEHESGVND